MAKWQEKKRAEAEQSPHKAQVVLEPQGKSREEPNWRIPAPPEGFISEDVSYAILRPVNAEEKEKTDAWKWYRDSDCGSLASASGPTTSVIHGDELFDFNSYDPRWMKDIALPQEAKHALFNARVAECRLRPGAKNIRACLNRATGQVDVGVDPEKWSRYLTSCGPKREMVYLSGDPEEMK